MGAVGKSHDCAERTHPMLDNPIHNSGFPRKPQGLFELCRVRRNSSPFAKLPAGPRQSNDVAGILDDLRNSLCVNVEFKIEEERKLNLIEAMNWMREVGNFEYSGSISGNVLSMETASFLAFCNGNDKKQKQRRVNFCAHYNKKRLDCYDTALCHFATDAEKKIKNWTARAVSRAPSKPKAMSLSELTKRLSIAGVAVKKTYDDIETSMKPVCGTLFPKEELELGYKRMLSSNAPFGAYGQVLHLDHFLVYLFVNLFIPGLLDDTRVLATEFLEVRNYTNLPMDPVQFKETLRLPWVPRVMYGIAKHRVSAFSAVMAFANRPHRGPAFHDPGSRGSLFALWQTKIPGVDADDNDSHRMGGVSYDTQFREWELYQHIQDWKGVDAANARLTSYIPGFGRV